MENEEFPFVEYFTAEEYEEFKKRITEYPFLKEKIEDSTEYLDSLKSQMSILGCLTTDNQIFTKNLQKVSAKEILSKQKRKDLIKNFEQKSKGMQMHSFTFLVLRL